MMTSTLNLTIAITLIICLLIPGIILFIKGRPYKNILLAMHLLLSFGFMAFIGIQLYNGTSDSRTIMIAMIGISFLLLILTGFLMIRERFNRLLVNLIHILATLCMLSGMAGLVF